MNVNLKSIAIGLVAGITSALLVLAATAQLSFSLVFLVLAGIPVFIAGLGFGAIASVAALAGSFATLSLAISPLFALGILALPQLPAAWMSYEANLARPASEIGGPEEVTAWYPLSDMLLHMAVIVAAALSATLLLTGYNISVAQELVDVAAEVMREQDPAMAYDDAMRASMAKLYFYLLPLMQALVSVVTIFAAYYFSALIVRMSTRSLRPREDMPSTLRMHWAGAFFFLGGIVLMFFGGSAGIVGAAVCGAFAGGFLLSGLASFHMRSRGKSWRTPALVLAYLTIFFSGFFFIATGLLDTRRAVALTPNGKSDKNENN
ncbi:DUF2232 domain-containing protein [Rhizobium sp. L1K21]|uniref:DUF2232 domain-containing protein n=1 Tax=Rhizobium sp. L1K21 TaxID=2954933 RepID=UPI002093A157|nr:DUF2232 domain-containing protein [Rhizobium sp. L1K21]MCO6186540.1 DUF2232 domain-containing protein [Rhizobium sp. L1K21]